MRIHNNKLAARIQQMEKRLTEIRSKTGEIPPMIAEVEVKLQQAVNFDIATLAKFGYNKYGKKMGGQ